MLPRSAGPAERLAIYLNDHLAGATGTARLAARTAGAMAGSPAAAELAELAAELEADRVELAELMRRLHVARSPVKPLAAAVGERLGRLKPNGHLRGRSPLSTLLELQLLHLGAEANAALWRSLVVLVADGTLDEAELDRLERRSRGQAQRYAALQPAAATAALTTVVPPA